MERKSFVFYKDWNESIKNLPDDIRLELYDAIMEYAFTGQVGELSPMVSIAFSFIKPGIDRDTEKYTTVTERNKANGSKGGRPKRTEPNKPSGLNENPKNLDNDNDNVNDKDNDSDNGDTNVSKEKDNNKLLSQKENEFQAKFIKQKEKLLSPSQWQNIMIQNHRISDMGDAIDQFREHIILKTDNGINDFLNSSDSDIKRWFSNWAPMFYKPPQPEITLGAGEYLDKGKRYYPYGRGRREVPPDAPPRPSDCYGWSKDANGWVYSD